MIDVATIGPVDVSQWATDDDNPIFPVGSKPKKLPFDMARVNEILTALSQANCAHLFTLNRAQFVERLIECRQKRLAAALGI